MAEGKTTVTAAAGGGALGIFAGFTLNPEIALKILEWVKESFTPAGLAFLFACVVSLVGNWLMWVRLKEKDTECQSEMELTRDRWSKVVEKTEDTAERRQKEAREDRDKIADIVGELTTQVTLLAERARPSSVRTRSNDS